MEQKTCTVKGCHGIRYSFDNLFCSDCREQWRLWLLDFIPPMKKKAEMSPRTYLYEDVMSQAIEYFQTNNIMPISKNM